MDTIAQVREFANQNPVAWMAKAENNQPHVRGVWMWFADETGFYFHTGTQKRFATQLMNNPKVEFAFFRQGEQQGESQMVRVTGEAEILEDKTLENKLFEERAWLQDVKSAYPNDRIFGIGVDWGRGIGVGPDLFCL